MKGNVKHILGVLAALALLGVCIGLAVYFSTKKDDEASENAATCQVPPCYSNIMVVTFSAGKRVSLAVWG